MHWLSIECAHCGTAYKRKAKSVAPGLSAETRRAMPCPHCFRLQPRDARTDRARRLGWVWLLVLVACAGLGFGLGALGLQAYAPRAFAAVALVAGLLTVGLELVTNNARYKLRAIRLMEAGELLDPDENGESLYQQAGRAAAAGDQETTAKLLYRVAALTPTRLEAWTELAQSLASLQRFDEAFAALERAQILEPDSLLVWQAKAGCSLSAGRLEEALRHLDHVLEKAPGDATVWANRAMVLQRLKRLPEALDSAGEAVDKDPANPVNWLNQARLQEQLGDPGARESYRSFLARAEALGASHHRGVDLEARAREVRARLGLSE